MQEATYPQNEGNQSYFGKTNLYTFFFFYKNTAHCIVERQGYLRMNSTAASISLSKGGQNKLLSDSHLA